MSRWNPINKQIKGQKFGRWTCLTDATWVRKDRFEVLCGCSCSRRTEKLVDFRALRRGHSNSCGCLRIEAAYRVGFKGYKNFGHTEWWGIKNGAKKRDIPFNISLKDAVDLFEKQKGICPYTGRLLTLGDVGHKNKNRTASLDRIDSSKPYNIKNCEWIYLPLNQMKRSLSKETFIALCYMVTYPQKVDLNHSTPEYIIKCVKNKFIKGWESRQDCSIDFIAAYSILEIQNFCCAITGIKLRLPVNTKELRSHVNNASLDRIDSNVGYHDNNIQWVYTDINFMKLSHSMGEFRSICKEISDYCCIGENV